MPTEYRWPAIIAAAMGILVSLVVLGLEFTAIAGRRGGDFFIATSNDLPDKECVHAVNIGDLVDRYSPVNARPPTLWCNTFINIVPASFCPTFVDCQNEKVNTDMVTLAMAMVHQLEYSVLKKSSNNNDDTVPLELLEMRDATREVAMGRNYKITNASWYVGLSAAVNPKSLCSDIYPNAQYLHDISQGGDEIKHGTLTIECNGGWGSSSPPESPPNSPPPLTTPRSPPSGPPPPDNPHSDLDTLYTHCVDQFSYARYKRDTGKSDYGGSMGIPVYGNVLMPNYEIFLPSGFNSSVHYDKRARILVGIRFGFDMGSYVPSIMLDCFLVLDCIFVCVTFFTLSIRIKAAVTGFPKGSSGYSMTDAIFKMYSTANMKRADRFFLSTSMWVVALLLRIFVSFGQWDAFSDTGNFPLPTCTGDGGGGWQKDDEVRGWAIFAIIGQMFVILAVLIGRKTTINYERVYKTDEQQRGLQPGSSETMPGSTKTRLIVMVVTVGALVVLAGQIWTSIAFGQKWAVTILETEDTQWDAARYSEAVFSKSMGSLAIGSTVGLLLASVLARWFLAPGHSKSSCYVFLIWGLVTLTTFVPLLIIDGFNFADQSEYTMECKNFADTEEGMACLARYWFFLVGIAILFAPVALMLVTGILRYSNVNCAPGNRSTSSLDKGSKSLLRSMIFERRRLGTAAVLEDAPLLENVPLLGLRIAGTRKSGKIVNSAR